MSSIRELILAEGVISIRDDCKGCDDCVKVCPNNAITVNGLGTKHIIDPTKCLSCGQCLITCPFGRIEDKSMVDEVKEALAGNKVVVVQEAPAVRAGLGEAFGLETGTDVEGQMIAALQQLGFDHVYDTVFGADMTIMEEGHELIGRLMRDMGVPGYETVEGKIPQFTSCCPGWVRYAELNYPDMLEHLSTAKSPMMMQAAVTKTYGAQQLGVDPADMFSVAVMPCTSKKYESSRPEFISSGYRDIDAVITTRELAQMIEEAGIDLASLAPSEPESLLGQGSGAGVIFGNTGGVMEAALRTAYAALSGEELGTFEITAVRGEDAVRSATVTIPFSDEWKAATGLEQLDLNVAVVSGSQNVTGLMEEVAAGTSPYHFIEVMNCPGGCVNGGGQPINHEIL